MDERVPAGVGARETVGHPEQGITQHMLLDAAGGTVPVVRINQGGAFPLQRHADRHEWVDVLAGHLETEGDGVIEVLAPVSSGACASAPGGDYPGGRLSGSAAHRVMALLSVAHQMAERRRVSDG
jgi:uncharacterized cupin superfamily protein